MGTDHKYARLISQVISHQWAMEPRAFQMMLSFLDQFDISPESEAFHVYEPEQFQTLTESLGEKIDGTKYAYKKSNVGFLTVYGPIIPYASWLEGASGLVSIESLSKSFKTLEADPSIDEIVLFMDTPGGDITGISEFADLVRNTEKYTTAHIIGMAASAGYWIASAANRITSVDTGLAGSIGVVTTIVDRSEQYKKVGVKVFDIVSSQSPRKRTDLTTPEGRTEVQEIMDDLARDFIAAVSQGRNVDDDTVIDDFGRGAVLSAIESLVAGMTDEIISTGELFAELFESEFQAQDRRQGSMVIQSLIFSKKVFKSRESAINWARDHDFTADKVDETSTSWRIRQRNPGEFSRFVTKEIDTGVSAVMGPLKQRSASATGAQEREAVMGTEEKAITATNEVVKPETEAAPEETNKPDAAKEERERIKAIEAIEKDYADQPPTVRAAVRKTIDANKFEENETAESVRSKVKDAVIAAQSEVIAKTRETRSELAEKIAAVPDAPSGEEDQGNNSEAVDDRKVKNIAEGYNGAE